MPHWYVKAAIQGTISLLPDPQAANRLLQKHVTKTLNRDRAYHEKKISVARRHLANWLQISGHAELDHVMELGTGWQPLVPVAMSLLGVNRVTTLDIQQLVTSETMQHTLSILKTIVDDDPEAFCPDAAKRLEDARRVEDVEGALEALGISAIVGDATALEMETASVDLITSNNRFDHIPAVDLGSILTEFRRVVRPDGAMSHFIDLKDHFAQVDHGITPYNFLRFSEAKWQKFDNALQFQNRLRWSDYRGLVQETGWSIAIEETSGESAFEEGFQIAPEFSEYDESDLLIHSGWMGLRPHSRRSDRAGSDLA